MEYPVPVTLEVFSQLWGNLIYQFAAHRAACSNWGVLFCCSFMERLKIKLALLLIYPEMISVCYFFRQKALNIIKMLSDLNSDPTKMPY